MIHIYPNCSHVSSTEATRLPDLPSIGITKIQVGRTAPVQKIPRMVKVGMISQVIRGL